MTSFRFSAAVAASLICLTLAPAHAQEPIFVTPDDVQWRAMGPPGMEVAVLTGDPMAEGVYTMLIKVPAGMRLPPHTHADAWRHSVVVSGTLLFGIGETFDEAAMRELPQGSFWTEHADVAHFAWARDGEVIGLLTAMGPSGTTPVK